jgi:RNA polymerase primary sigma factor
MDDYQRHIQQFPVLTVDEEIAIFKRVAVGDWEAREIAVNCNLRLVRGVVYQLNMKKWDEDLQNEGVLGLIEAVDNFDLRFKTKFSTHATYWIKQSIKKMEGRSVLAPPYHMNSFIRKWDKAEKELMYTLGRSPSIEEVNNSLSFKPEDYSKIRDARKVSKIEGILIDIQQSIGYSNVEDINLFQDLNEKEISVLKMVHGLDPYTEMNFREIGEELGISHEWARHMYNGILEKFHVGFDEEG